MRFSLLAFTASALAVQALVACSGGDSPSSTTTTDAGSDAPPRDAAPPPLVDAAPRPDADAGPSCAPIPANASLVLDTAYAPVIAEDDPDSGTGMLDYRFAVGPGGDAFVAMRASNQQWRVVHVLADGRVDGAFGAAGGALVALDLGDGSIVGDSHGGVVLGGRQLTTNGDSALVRLLPDGEPDPSFGDHGVAAIPASSDYTMPLGIGPYTALVTEIDTGYLVALGVDHTYRVSRDGKTALGGRIPNANELEFCSFMHGRSIVLACNSQVIRFDETGALVGSFGDQGRLAVQDAWWASPQEDDGILVLRTGAPMVRFDKTGAPDQAFDAKNAAFPMNAGGWTFPLCDGRTLALWAPVAPAGVQYMAGILSQAAEITPFGGPAVLAPQDGGALTVLDFEVSPLDGTIVAVVAERGAGTPTRYRLARFRLQPA